MRHVGEVDDHRVARDVLAEEERDLHLLGLAVGFLDHFAEADQLPLLVGHFDADGVLAGDRGDDADARHAQGDGQVVGQAGDLREPQAGFQLDLELGDDRAGFDLDDPDVEAEIEERLFQDLGLAADFFFVLFVADVFVREQQFERRELVSVSSTDCCSAASSCSMTVWRSVFGGGTAVDGVGCWRVFDMPRAAFRPLASLEAVLVVGRVARPLKRPRLWWTPSKLSRLGCEL